MKTSDIIATIGVTILVVAFLLQNLKIIKSEGATYGFLNFIGAAIACYASWLISFYPFVILEGIWSCIALHGIIKFYLAHKSST